MKELKLLLNTWDLVTLLHMIDEKEKQINDLVGFGHYSFGLLEKMTQNLTEAEKEEMIRMMVNATISRLIGRPSDQIEDKHSLTRDLQMTSQEIRSLAMSFTSIARKFKEGATITPNECEEQDTVRDCVDLIINKTK